MTQRRVLVTGASGFVGGALGRWLREHEGMHVTGLSRGAPREHAADVSISHDIRTPLPTLQHFDAIVHCAALVSPWAAPAEYEATNINALTNVLDFARRTRPDRFILVSSSSVHYEFADQLDLREDTPWPAQAINLYADSKRRGEAMVLESGLPITIVRPRAVFGPGDTVVFPRFLEAARRGVLPRLRRADGVAPRSDLLFIENLCWYIARVLEKDAGGVFCLTDGEPVETQAMLDQVLERLELPLPKREVAVSMAMLAGGAMEWYSRLFQRWREPPVTRFGVASLAYSKTFDIAHARAVLGRPPFTLAEGMDRFIAWQKARTC